MEEQVVSSLDKIKKFFHGVTTRIGVHILSLSATSVIGSSLPTNFPLSTQETELSFYVGLICLFHRGIFSNSSWHLSVILATIQFLVCVFLGIPWQIAVFFAGLQAWVLRFFFRKRTSSDWIVLPFLITCVGYTFTSFSFGVTFFLTSIPAVTFIGFILQKYIDKYITIPQIQTIIEKNLEILQKIILLEKCPAPLKPLIRQLTSNVTLLQKSLPILNNKDFDTIFLLQPITQQLHYLQKRNDSTVWDERAVKVYSNILKINGILVTFLNNLDFITLPDSDPKKNTSESRIDYFSLLVNNLFEKKNDLPESLHKNIESICNSAKNILTVMQQDDVEFSSGERFLNRYLKATQSILEDYIKLSENKPNKTQIDDVLSRCEELLSRLDAAFSKEHASLLTKNAMDLNAELSTIDTLLKMEGR